MYDLPFKIDLSNKIVAITGAGGIICGEFAKALAACGAQVGTRVDGSYCRLGVLLLPTPQPNKIMLQQSIAAASPTIRFL